MNIFTVSDPGIEKFSSLLQKFLLENSNNSIKDYSKYSLKFNYVEITYSKIIMLISLSGTSKAYCKFGNFSFYYRNENSNESEKVIETKYVKPFVEALKIFFDRFDVNSIDTFEEVTYTENIGILNDEKTATINLKVTGKCNENCYFCTQVLDGYSFSLNDIKKTVNYIANSERYKSYKKENLIFHVFGGEPTTHPQYFEIIDFLIEENYHFRVDTNAVNFSKQKFVDSIAKKKDMEFLISAHAHESKLYDKVTCSRNLFEKNIRGVKNILANSTGYTEINHLITKENITYLREFLELYLREFRPIREKNVRLVLSTIIVEDPKKSHAQIPYAQVAQAIQKNKKFILDNHIPLVCVAASIEMDIPYCIIESVTIKTAILAKDLKKRRSDFKHFRQYMKKCDDCFLKQSCVGVQKSYIENFGESEFIPLTKESFENSEILQEIILLG